MSKCRDSMGDRRECFIRCKSTDAHGRVVMYCHICNGVILPAQEKWEADHVVPLAHGGQETLPAHVRCHREKTSITDIPAIAKGKRQRDSIYGIKRPRGFRKPPAGYTYSWRQRRWVKDEQ